MSKVEQAENPNTPPETLVQLASDEDWRVRRGVAENPSTPAAALVQLASDEDWRVRKTAAQNPSTPTEILARLASGKSAYVRQYVAENPSTPVEILVRLASDENERVRRNVAENPSSPTEILAQLASDERVRVRWRVAQNPNTPTEILVQLASDEDEYVRQYVAENPSTPAADLAQLASDENEGVRRYVARNPNTPPETLAQLASDEDWRVREDVAKNPNLESADYRDYAAGDEKERAFAASRAHEAGDYPCAALALCGVRSRLLATTIADGKIPPPKDAFEWLRLIRSASTFGILKSIDPKNTTERIGVYGSLLGGEMDAFLRRTQDVDLDDLKKFTPMIRVSKTKLFNMIVDAPDGQANAILSDTVGEALSVLSLTFESDEEREAVLENYLSNLRLYEPSSLIELHDFVMKHARLAKTFDPKAAVVNRHPIYSTDLVGGWYHRLAYGEDRTFAIMVPENESEYSENGIEQQVCLGNLTYADDVRGGKRVIVNILDVDRDEVIGSILYDIGARGSLNVVDAAYKNNHPGGLKRALPGLTEMIGNHIEEVIYDFLTD